jgi:NAD-dependent dihydropyrimidine dehydrogenase PreA subunit
VIEIVSETRCVECNICVKVCPADVFDAAPAGAPLIARQDDCQTCFLCELYCPADALFVDAQAERAPHVREADIEAAGLFGSYARAMGWNRGKPGGADRDPTFNIRAAMPG